LSIDSKSKKKYPVVIIFGPTAIGKTNLIENIFNKNYEIINADSMQVYKYMDVGTAKPFRELQEKLPHHLIDIVDPTYQFNAGEFVKRAEELIKKIYNKNKVPIIAGGTAFYIKNFIFGLPESPQGDSGIRHKLKTILKQKGIGYLYKELGQIDPSSAQRIDISDTYRIIRALEVYRATGKPLSAFKVPKEVRKDYSLLLIGLMCERQELYKRINLRVDWMFEHGLVEEVKKLITMGFKQEDPGLRGIGYKEFFTMSIGCFTLWHIREIIKQNSRRFAKRQISFFKGLPNVHWFNIHNEEEIKECIDRFYRG